MQLHNKVRYSMRSHALPSAPSLLISLPPPTIDRHALFPSAATMPRAEREPAAQHGILRASVKSSFCYIRLTIRC